MIILPEEERKPSLILKWLFRLLLAIVILMTLSLFGLNMLSGTGDAHRRGLEQAMSQVLQSQVRIGKLKTFNIVPQLLVEMEDVQGQRLNGERFTIDDLVIAFSFTDIFFKNKNIEALQVKNLTMQAGLIGSHELHVLSAGIADDKKADRPYFRFEGRYGDMPFTAEFGIERFPAPGRSSYLVGDMNPVKITSGPFVLEGKYTQSAELQPEIREAVLSLNGKTVATGSVRIHEENKVSMLEMDFQIGNTKGVVSAPFSGGGQQWKFETLDLTEALAPEPVWAQITSAWHDNAAPSSKPELVSRVPDKVSVSIDHLTGVVAGEALQGEFLLLPEKILGWWEGNLTSMPEVKKGQPATGLVKCALVDLEQTAEAFKTQDMPIYIEPVSLKTHLTLERYTGKVSFGIDSVVSNKASIFGLKSDEFLLHKDKLGFDKALSCLELLNGKPAP